MSYYDSENCSYNKHTSFRIKGTIASADFKKRFHIASSTNWYYPEPYNRFHQKILDVLATFRFSLAIDKNYRETKTGKVNLKKNSTRCVSPVHLTGKLKTIVFVISNGNSTKFIEIKYFSHGYKLPGIVK